MKAEFIRHGKASNALGCIPQNYGLATRARRPGSLSFMRLSMQWAAHLFESPQMPSPRRRVATNAGGRASAEFCCRSRALTTTPEALNERVCETTSSRRRGASVSVPQRLHHSLSQSPRAFIQ